MQSKLIIHVGPPKCGSSTIQNFAKQKPFKGKVAYRFIFGPEVDTYNIKDIDSKEFKAFIKSLNKDLRQNDAVILSQEQFFPDAFTVENICKQVDTDNIVIIGYSRRQSGYLISAYNQWEFRSHLSYNYFSEVLVQNNINAVYFNGLETFLLGVIFSNFNPPLKSPRHRLYNWGLYYQKLKEASKPYTLIANCLPSKDYAYNLIEDFCHKTGLEIKKKKLHLLQERNNTQFDPILTESMHNALSFNIDVLPDEHKNNKELHRLSNMFHHNKYKKTAFVQMLANYIDSEFLSSNKDFCVSYNIPLTEFEPEKALTRDEILIYIKDEMEKRKNNAEAIILEQKKLTGEWMKFSYDHIIQPEINGDFIKNTLYLLVLKTLKVLLPGWYQKKFHS